VAGREGATGQKVCSVAERVWKGGERGSFLLCQEGIKTDLSNAAPGGGGEGLKPEREVVGGRRGRALSLGQGGESPLTLGGEEGGEKVRKGRYQ